jgi:hypothetical protein
VDLCFVGVARGVRLQNIDSIDLAGKMSGCNILRGFERYSVLGNQFPVASFQLSVPNAKGCAVRSLVCLTLSISILASGAGNHAVSFPHACCWC